RNVHRRSHVDRRAAPPIAPGSDRRPFELQNREDPATAPGSVLRARRPAAAWLRPTPGRRYRPGAPIRVNSRAYGNNAHSSPVRGKASIAALCDLGPPGGCEGFVRARRTEPGTRKSSCCFLRTPFVARVALFAHGGTTRARRLARLPFPIATLA